jgi:hypothetical protein
MTDASSRATLTWGVKQSFRNYVESAGGAIETGNGAGRADDGAFTFAAAPDNALSLGADGKPTGQGRFSGEVRMNAHGGMLKVNLADPWLEIGPEGTALTVIDNGLRNPRRVEFARLDLAAATMGDDGELAIPVALSNDGCAILGDHYPLKTLVDPARLKLR